MELSKKLPLRLAGTSKTLNRLHVGVGQSKENMRKWGHRDQSITYKCRHEEIMSCLLVYPLGPSPCTEEDLMMSNHMPYGYISALLLFILISLTYLFILLYLCVVV